MTTQTNQRKYKRLKGVYPVEFTVVRLQGDLIGLDWKKGSTENVSEEGMCLDTTDLNESMINYLKQENVHLELRVLLPQNEKPIKAVCEVAWYLQDQENAVHFTIGLKYLSITKAGLKKILRYTKKFLLTIWAIVLLASVSFMIIFYYFYISFISR